jgi:hypothetical protein
MRMQPCLIWIVMDIFPMEIGWKLKDSVTKEYVVEVPIGSYTLTDDEVVVPVDLIPGRGYRFIIVDEYGDGLGGLDAGYSVILGTDLKNGVRLLEGKGTFGARGGRSFTVPGADAAMPSLSPSSSILPAPGSPSAAPSPSTATLPPMSSSPSILFAMPPPASGSPTTTMTTVTTSVSQSVVPGTIPFSASTESGSAASITVSFWSGNHGSLWFALAHTAAVSAAILA